MSHPAIVALVDDDEAIRESMASLLRAHGVIMRSFASAEAFLAHANHGEIGCLITDVHMPGLSGLELVRRLRGRGVGYPIIVMSALEREPTRAAAHASGADAYLAKPVEPGELIAWLSRLRGRG